MEVLSSPISPFSPGFGSGRGMLAAPDGVNGAFASFMMLLISLAKLGLA
jgi:hypothetical protein